MRVCYRVARDVGCTVAEVLQRVSWPEMMGWIEFYTMEADEALPPKKRPVRARTPEEAAAALDRAFKPRRN